MATSVASEFPIGAMWAGRSMPRSCVSRTKRSGWTRSPGARCCRATSTSNFNVVNDYDWFSGLYGSTRKPVPWQDTEVYLLARNAGPPAPDALAAGVPGLPSSARDIYTVGTRWKSALGQLGKWELPSSK